jgi:hypothetical protein
MNTIPAINQNRETEIQQMVVFKGEDDPALLKRIEKLRLEVWGELVGARLAAKRFGLDSFDYKAWHIAYIDDSDLIASGRLIIATCESGVPDLCSFRPYLGHMEYPIGILNRLFVNRTCRGRGMATCINEARIKLAHDYGVTSIWVEVQLHRAPSMERLGFFDVGPSLDKSVVGDWRIMRRNT